MRQQLCWYASLTSLQGKHEPCHTLGFLSGNAQHGPQGRSSVSNIVNCTCVNFLSYPSTCVYLHVCTMHVQTCMHNHAHTCTFTCILCFFDTNTWLCSLDTFGANNKLCMWPNWPAYTRLPTPATRDAHVKGLNASMP